MSGKGFVRPGQAIQIGVIAVLVLLTCFAGGAAATATGGAGTPGAAPTAKGSPSGAPSSAPSAGTLTLLAAETTPRKSFYFGYRYPRLSYTIGSSQPQNDLRIDVVNSAGEIVKTFYREDVAPDVENKVRWDGTSSEGKPARNGRYSFRISPQTATAPAARKASTSTTLSLGFAFYGYAFPILGAHEYGLSAGRFGAGRSGHTHQGQDVMADCGTPLVAARGGIVQYSGYQSAAGNYVVLHTDEGELKRLHGPHRPADRDRRHHRLLHRLPPALRDVGRTRLVRGRLPLRSPRLPAEVGRLQLTPAGAKR